MNSQPVSTHMPTGRQSRCTHREACSPRGGRTSQIIVNADDFGRSTAINEAVCRAHREGILTSASLMVSGEAAEEAVDLARRMPSLAVGLHLVLCDGSSILPHDEVPHLVDPQRHFRHDPLRAGLCYFASPQAKAEVAREVAAQFEWFAATGLPLSHVDGHCHLHLHPTVLDCVLPLAARYGAGGLRIPHDCLWRALRCDRRRTATKLLWGGLFTLLAHWSRKKLRTYDLPAASRTFGLFQSGHMRSDYLVDVITHLRAPTAEIYFHPTTGPRTDGFGPNPGDLEALLNPAVKAAVERHGRELATYATLRAG